MRGFANFNRSTNSQQDRLQSGIIMRSPKIGKKSFHQGYQLTILNVNDDLMLFSKPNWFLSNPPSRSQTSMTIITRLKYAKWRSLPEHVIVLSHVQPITSTNPKAKNMSRVHIVPFTCNLGRLPTTEWPCKLQTSGQLNVDPLI